MSGHGVMPDYIVKSYSRDFKKIVRMKNGACSLRLNWDDVLCTSHDNQKVGDKFYSSYARAKSTFFDIVMSNEWDYFVTLTLDPEKYNRHDLRTWRRDLNQWFRDLRKDGFDISYAFVPERHKDGAWHIHGLLRCPQLWDCLRPFERGKHPQKLVEGAETKLWRWWPEYQERFGFSSFAPIMNHEACCRYVCKYITKDMARVNSGLNAQLYSCSVGLKRPDKHHVYGVVTELDKVCTYDSAYACVGYCSVDDDCLLGWCCMGGNMVYINGVAVGGEFLCVITADDFIEISDAELDDSFPWSL